MDFCSKRRRRTSPARPLAALTVLTLWLSGIGGGVTSRPANAQGGASWLDIANAYRTSVGLAALGPDSTLQRGVEKHVEYLSATGSLQHGQAIGHPLYTPEGDVAAQQSVLGGWTGGERSDRELIDGWMAAPFHAIHLFEPRLARVAFASVRGRTGNKLPSAAVMNIIGGIGPKVIADKPIVFPGRNSVIPLTTFTVETPDPLTHCPGYSAPAGLGLIAMFAKPVMGASATLTANGVTVESCVVDTSYRNPDPSAQNVVRYILGQKNAVVVMPRQPLEPSTVYEVAVIAGDQQVSWTFTAAASGSDLPTKATETIGFVPVSGGPKRTKTAAKKATTTNTTTPQAKRP